MDMQSQFKASLYGIQQQNADTRQTAALGLIDAKTQSLALQGQALDARSQAAAANAALAQERITNAANAAGNSLQEKSDTHNEVALKDADAEAEKQYGDIQKITDPAAKAAAYTSIGVDPTDPNADALLRSAVQSSVYAGLPKKVTDWASTQGKNLDPYDTLKARLSGVKPQWGGTPPGPTAASATPDATGAAPTSPTATTAAATPQTTTPGSSQFINGKIYQDAQGNKAMYQDGNWIPQ